MKVQLPRRRLIPRWRQVGATLRLPEGQSHTISREPKPLFIDSDEFERAVWEWNETPTAGHLGNVLAFSISSTHLDEIYKIAQEAKSKNTIATSPQLLLIDELLGERKKEDKRAIDDDSICNPHIRQCVRESRKLLRANPSNPLALLDFAQLQLAAGNAKRAERSLLTALAVSPDNRIVLRTLSRFYVHLGSNDQAHSLLARHERTKSDPWLMASEIAISQTAGISSKFAKVALKIAKEKRRNYANYTELAGAIGGLELSNGNWNRARELFRIALMSPNDNVIAQAITDQQNLLLDLTAPEQQRVFFNTAEARALLSWRVCDAGGAENHALLWHAEEPFSSRPLQFLTAVFAVQEEYERLIALSRRGLVTDPKDPVLTANLSFGLANMGRLDEAERMAIRARGLNAKMVGPQTTATQGLIAIKRENFSLADDLYSEAIYSFLSDKREDMASICYAYFARAAIEMNHPRALEIIEIAVQNYERTPSIDAALILEKIHKSIERPKLDENAKKINQFVYDKKTNTLIRKEHLSPPGAPPIIFDNT